MWSTPKNTIASTLCWNSVLGLSKRGFLVQSPPSLTWGDGLCVHLVPTCSLVTPGAVLCASALLTAHPMVHQTSLIKGKCRMNYSIVKNFKVTTALTKARGHRYKTRALEKPLCGLQGPSGLGVGWSLDRSFLHMQLQALLSAGWTTVGTACLCGGAVGLPSSVRTAMAGREVVLP